MPDDFRNMLDRASGRSSDSRRSRSINSSAGAGSTTPTTTGTTRSKSIVSRKSQAIFHDTKKDEPALETLRWCLAQIDVNIDGYHKSLIPILKKRIEERMAKLNIACGLDLNGYREFIDAHFDTELPFLADLVPIHVTEWLRDSHVWQFLDADVLPKLANELCVREQREAEQREAVLWEAGKQKRRLAALAAARNNNSSSSSNAHGGIEAIEAGSAAAGGIGGGGGEVEEGGETEETDGGEGSGPAALKPSLPDVRCWSVGCSSGEEAYGISCLFRMHDWSQSCDGKNDENWQPERQPQQQQRQRGRPQSADSSGRNPQNPKNLISPVPKPNAPSVSVLATDIAAPIIDTAKAAEYGEEGLKAGVPAAWIRECFQHRPAKRLYRVNSAVRSCVSFECQDITKEGSPPPLPGAPGGSYFHCVFVRNSCMMYFTHSQKQRTLQVLVDRLAPGGFLVLGIKECLPLDWCGLVEYGDPALHIYRKPGPPPPLSREKEAAVRGRARERPWAQAGSTPSATSLSTTSASSHLDSAAATATTPAPEPEAASEAAPAAAPEAAPASPAVHVVPLKHQGEEEEEEDGGGGVSVSDLPQTVLPQTVVQVATTPVEADTTDSETAYHPDDAAEEMPTPAAGAAELTERSLLRLNKKVKEATDAFQRGGKDACMAILKEVLAEDARHVQANNNMAFALLRKTTSREDGRADAVANADANAEHLTDALLYAEAATTADPSYKQAWKNKGTILLSLGEAEKAMVCFQYALDLDPAFKAADEGKVYCLMALKSDGAGATRY